MKLYIFLGGALLFLFGCTGTSAYYAGSYGYPLGYQYGYRYGDSHIAGFVPGIAAGFKHYPSYRFNDRFSLFGGGIRVNNYRTYRKPFGRHRYFYTDRRGGFRRHFDSRDRFGKFDRKKFGKFDRNRFGKFDHRKFDRNRFGKFDRKNDFKLKGKRSFSRDRHFRSRGTFPKHPAFSRGFRHKSSLRSWK